MSATQHSPRMLLHLPGCCPLDVKVTMPVEVSRIGLEAGPLSQWLYAGMREAGLAVELPETRHVRDAFKTMPVKGLSRWPAKTSNLNRV